MDLSDKELISRYSGGDIDALEVLVERYRGKLFGYIIGMTRSQVEADDIYQEVWFRAIKKLDGYKAGNLGGWLTRIAHNLVIDRARKKKPLLTLDQEFEDGGSMIDVVPGKDIDPGAAAAASEIGVKIQAAIEMLPIEQKEVFILRTKSDMPFKDIAEMQKVSINTALARMQYALAGLRPLLKEVYDEV